MLSKVLQRFRSSLQFRGKSQQVDARKTTSDMLCALLRTCDVCGRGLPSDHHFAQVASVVVGAGQTPSVAQLTNAIAAKDWQLLTSFNQWRGDRNNLVAYAVACPESGGMLLQIYDPFELYDSEHLQNKERLPAEEMQALSGCISEKAWETL